MQLKNILGVSVCSFNGGYLQFQDDDGVHIGTVDLQPGIHDLSPYQPILSAGTMSLNKCFVLKSPHGRNLVSQSDKTFQSAAAITYTPSLAEQQEHQMRSMVKTILREQRKVEDERAERAASERKRRQINDETSDDRTTGTVSVSEQELVQDDTVEAATVAEGDSGDA